MTLNKLAVPGQAEQTLFDMLVLYQVDVQVNQCSIALHKIPAQIFEQLLGQVNSLVGLMLLVLTSLVEILPQLLPVFFQHLTLIDLWLTPDFSAVQLDKLFSVLWVLFSTLIFHFRMTFQKSCFLKQTDIYQIFHQMLL